LEFLYYARTSSGDLILSLFYPDREASVYWAGHAGCVARARVWTVTGALQVPQQPLFLRTYFAYSRHTIIWQDWAWGVMARIKTNSKGRAISRPPLGLVPINSPPVALGS